MGKTTQKLMEKQQEITILDGENDAQEKRNKRLKGTNKNLQGTINDLKTRKRTCESELKRAQKNLKKVQAAKLTEQRRLEEAKSKFQGQDQEEEAVDDQEYDQ